NLRAALEWLVRRADWKMALRLAADLGHFWRASVYVGEGRAQLEALLAKADAADAVRPELAVRARAWSWAGTLAWAQGDFARAETCHQRARGLYEAAGHDAGVAFSLNHLGVLAKYQGDLAQAAACFDASLALYASIHDEWGVALAETRRGILALDTGDLDHAARILDQALSAWRRLGDREYLAVTLVNLGELALKVGDSDQAERHLTEALGELNAIGEQGVTAYTLTMLGDLERRRGANAAAARYYGDALAVNRELGARLGIAQDLERFADLAAASDPAGAVRLLGSAAAIRKSLNAPWLPLEAADRRATVASARVALGENAYAAAWAAGEALSESEAIREARAIIPETPGTLGALELRGRRGVPRSGVDLTRREREVLRLLQQRLSDAEIAARLSIGVRTVEFHVANILGKLGAGNRRDAVAIAARSELLA
ncbi:MAG TPA: tetratricopeptide repeat protein, partial [Vicinamibacteria bacterium]|nr:tetratricopeptide repeat protein [Vicinamibacteria bacterium]